MCYLRGGEGEPGILKPFILKTIHGSRGIKHCILEYIPSTNEGWAIVFFIMTVYLWGLVKWAWVSAQHNRTGPIRYQKEMRTKLYCQEARGPTQTQQNSEGYFGK